MNYFVAFVIGYFLGVGTLWLVLRNNKKRVAGILEISGESISEGAKKEIAKALNL